MDKKTDLNVLCLSFWIPPLVRPRAIAIGKLMPEWIAQGVKPVIMAYDTGQKEEWDIGVPVYKIPRFKLNRVFSKIYPIKLLFWKIYYKKLFNIAKDIIKKHNCNLAFSFSNPQDSNIVGAMLKDRLGVKFISHFSDPWYDNFVYHSYTKITGLRVLRLENYVIKNSDSIVFTNEQAEKLVMKKYPKKYQEKARVISHCYNPKEYPQISKDLFGKFIISYIGAFYKQRNPEILFTALGELIKTNSELADKFKLVLVGVVNDYAGYSLESINKMAEENNISNNIEIIPIVNYNESLKYMKQSDCLVVIDANVPNSPFLPSKVIDYAGSGKMIIGITTENSPTAIFLKSLGYEYFFYTESDKLKDYLGKAIKGEVKQEINADFLKQFSLENITKDFIKLFQEVLDAK